MRVDFSLTCYSYDGIDVIRLAMLTAKHEVNNADWNLEFRLIAPPNYRVEVQTHNKSEGEQKLKESLAVIKQVMKKNGGHFKQKGEIVIVDPKHTDQVDVADLIEQMKMGQNTGAGDSDDDSNEEEDNEEGMDVDLNEQVAEAASDDDEEEKKE